MKCFVPLRKVSSIRDTRYTQKQKAPALRIAGKWLNEFCNIGDNYRIVRTGNPDELVIKFIRNANDI